MSQPSSEKTDAITPAPARSSGSIDAGKLENAEDAFEVFKRGEGEVDFRTVGWIQASVIFLKGKAAAPLFLFITNPSLTTRPKSFSPPEF